MALSRTVQGLAEANKKQEETLHEMREVMDARFSELSEEVRHLRERLGEQEDALPAAKRQKKRAHSAPLSEMVRRLHNGEENELKYNGDEGLKTPHNETVTSFLMKEVAAASQYPPDAIRAACVSYYETIRRRHVQSRPENVEKSAKQKSEKCHRSRRKRLLAARAGVLQTEEEASLWKGVTADLMSDEEGSEVNGVNIRSCRKAYLQA